jgi:hypothetical protein
MRRLRNPTPAGAAEERRAALIDELLPLYDFVERHWIGVRAPAHEVYDAVRRLDLGASPPARLLLRLRGFRLRARRDAPARLTLDGFLEAGFILLGERPPVEIALGVVGTFWSPSGGVLRMDAERFRTFARPGYAKAVWNFSLHPASGGTTHLRTETRVRCLDEVSRRRFRLYWLFVQPFSGLLRREALRLSKLRAEGGRSSR